MLTHIEHFFLIMGMKMLDKFQIWVNKLLWLGSSITISISKKLRTHTSKRNRDWHAPSIWCNTRTHLWLFSLKKKYLRNKVQWSKSVFEKNKLCVVILLRSVFLTNFNKNQLSVPPNIWCTIAFVNQLTVVSLYNRITELCVAVIILMCFKTKRKNPIRIFFLI